MAKGKFVAYYRVSTDKQGRSGLGLEGQREDVERFLNGGDWHLVAEFQEIESGRKDDRPELTKALAACELYNATLVIAKLDRLTRDAHFLLGLKKADIDFVCCDMPDANRLTVGIMALIAEEEARLISQRTKSALAAAKARGVVLGNPKNLTREGRIKGTERSSQVRAMEADRKARSIMPVVEDLRRVGITSLNGIARELNERGIETPRGGRWRATQVRNALVRVGFDKGRIPRPPQRRRVIDLSP